MGFAEIMGYALGMLTMVVILGICLKKIRLIARFVVSSLCGIGVCLLINYIGGRWGIHIGINPLTAVVLGALGVPGVIVILLAQIFY